MSRRIGRARVSDGYLGAGGRLEGGPAPELVASGYAHELDAAPRLAPWLSLADLAHAVALAEAGAIPADDARALLAGLLDLDAIAPAEFPWRAELGDAFNLHDAVLDGAAALVDLAERHAGDLAADYTYLQPAQPTTIGHLLLAYAYPALRDAERLRAAHGRLDLSVAGAGGS